MEVATVVEEAKITSDGPTTVGTPPGVAYLEVLPAGDEAVSAGRQALEEGTTVAVAVADGPGALATTSPETARHDADTTQARLRSEGAGPL